MIDTPQTVQTTAHQAAVIRLTIPRSEMRNAFGPAVQELMSTLAGQGVKPVGLYSRTICGCRPTCGTSSWVLRSHPL